MSDIFLSYASEDRERVKPLAEALIQEGWSVFWDRVIPVSKAWHEVLEEELQAACGLVVVWSQHSVQSIWVIEEATEGKRLRLPIFGVLLDDVLPPFGFRLYQAADFTRWEGATDSPVFQILVRDIQKILGFPAPYEPERQEPEPTETKPSEPEPFEAPPPEPMPPEVRKGCLWINSEPRNATIRFLNFEAEFSQGMSVEPGSYEIEVLADGYEAKREQFQIDAEEDKQLSVTLTKLNAYLWVETEPPNATVKFINLEAKFTQGVELEPGKYGVGVSAKGYETKIEEVELDAGEEKTLSITLSKLKAHLWLETDPPDATVRILNLEVEFTQGMELDPGRYVIELSKEGYEAKSEEIELGAGEDRHISLGLSPILEPDLVDEGKPEVSIAEPAETEPSEPEAAEPESLKPRAAEPTKAEAPEQVRKSRALLIGVSAGLALLLLLVGLWRFLPQRQPEKKVSPVESQPVIKEPKTITNSIGMKFVLIPAGTFQMGSPKGESGRDEDERQHQVTISRPFYLQTTEVTQGQWQKVMGNNPSHFKKCGQDCPVEQVSWKDAQEFIKKLNRMEDTDKYRLPTEAEWEYACRAGSKGRWCFGDDEADLKKYAWYAKNSGDQTHPVGQKKPNAWGLYDMHGNVYEWVQDWYGDYPAGPVTDPTGPATGNDRALRGGSWDSLAGGTRSAYRLGYDPDIRYDYIGFRVARAL